MKLNKKNGEASTQLPKLQIPMTKEQLEHFDGIKDRMGFSSRRELFENALWFMESVAARVEGGGTLLLEYPDNRTVEFTSPFLERVKQTAEAKMASTSA
jgi:hypothetical protein